MQVGTLQHEFMHHVVGYVSEANRTSQYMRPFNFAANRQLMIGEVYAFCPPKKVSRYLTENTLNFIPAHRYVDTFRFGIIIYLIKHLLKRLIIW